MFMREVRIGEIYRHFKGNLYQIVAVARHSETNENYVVYQALYGDMQVWIRPYEMFVSEVDHDKYPLVRQKYRFELLNTLANVGNMAGKDMPYPDTETADIGQPHIDTKTEDKAVVESMADNSPVDSANKWNDNYSELAKQGVDVRLLEFLDAPTCQDKINYLNLIRANIDDELINNIAAAMDITVDDGPIDARFFSLRSCLMTKAKYECVRR